MWRRCCGGVVEVFVEVFVEKVFVEEVFVEEVFVGGVCRRCL